MRSLSKVFSPSVIVQGGPACKSLPAVGAFDPQFQMHLDYVPQHAFSIHRVRITTYPAARHFRVIISCNTMFPQVARKLPREEHIAASLSANYPTTCVGLLVTRRIKQVEHHLLGLGGPVIVELVTDPVVGHDLWFFEPILLAPEACFLQYIYYPHSRVWSKWVDRDLAITMDNLLPTVRVSKASCHWQSRPFEVL